jgi:hypothetical protein
VTTTWGTMVKGRSARRALAAALLAFGADTFATAPAAMAAPPPSVPAPTAFHPQSVTFVSAETGWALGTVPCSGARACLALVHTTDAGTSWTSRPLPAPLVAEANNKANVDMYPGNWLNVRFADPLDGWVFGGFPNSGPVLWSTHDGGTTWRRENLPGLSDQGPVFDLEAASGTAYLMAANAKFFGVTVESSPVGHDNWHPDPTPPLSLPAGGAQPGGSFVFQAGEAWLLEGNGRGITGSAELEGQGRWGSWASPCAQVGDSYTVPAASSALDLFAVCQIGGFGSSVSKSDPPGAALGSTWLYVSDNGGKSFHADGRLGPLGPVTYGGVLASPSPGVVFLSRSGPSDQLLASFDGGHHWGVSYSGGLFYLGFTSAAQGVGLVQGARATTSMIMTFDGGHHWAPVKF